jgi:predicted metal-dependent phosphoesterase TrpH
VAAGVCTSPKEAFTRFLRDGGPADVPVDRLEVGEAVALARAAGARLSLAHPHTLGHPSLVRDLFVRHRGEGLEGIEACYGPYAKAERTPWLRLAQELDLVVTAGSDFHGDMVPEVTTPGTELPSEHADRLRQWLAA